jgi:hypothetical protein
MKVRLTYDANRRFYTVTLGFGMNAYHVVFSAEAVDDGGAVTEVPFEMVATETRPNASNWLEARLVRNRKPLQWPPTLTPRNEPKVDKKPDTATIRQQFGAGTHIEPNQNPDGTIGDTGRFL